MNTRKRNKLTIALIAHDTKKEDMIYLIKTHKLELTDIELVTTRSTGKLIQARIDQEVTLVESGAMGGDLQIGAMVADEQINAVIFLHDPLTSRLEEPDINTLLRVCDTHNVPLATNIVSAEAVLHLIIEHPEALGGHRLMAKYLEDMSAVHES